MNNISGSSCLCACFEQHELWERAELLCLGLLIRRDLHTGARLLGDRKVGREAALDFHVLTPGGLSVGPRPCP